MRTVNQNTSNTRPTTECNRAFVRIDQGLLHYLHAGAQSARNPLWMMHASPASSRSLEPLAIALAETHALQVFAIDTPGNGDSVALAMSEPTLYDYADAMVSAMDTLNIKCVDLYGFHTGAHIAIELAITHPERIGRVVLDGLLWLNEEERHEYLANYAPILKPDVNGTQFFTALQFIRDQAWFFPHFKRDAAHNLSAGAMSAELLHSLTLDLLKSVNTYHLPYRAVFNHRLADRLPLLRKNPALLMADSTDPTRNSVVKAAALITGSKILISGESWSPLGLAKKAKNISDFLASAD